MEQEITENDLKRSLSERGKQSVGYDALQCSCQGLPIGEMRCPPIQNENLRLQATLPESLGSESCQPAVTCSHIQDANFGQVLSRQDSVQQAHGSSDAAEVTVDAPQIIQTGLKIAGIAQIVIQQFARGYALHGESP